ncbi:MAG TPA: HEAT repeat domain-containing protein [Polyangiaceae bacterium]|nr:HEAT repeat domain-containing protein [Polyangiaceae bacterium]
MRLISLAPAVLLLSIGCRSSAEAESNSASDATKPAASATAAPRPAVEPGFALGQRYEYALSSTSKVAFQAQGDLFDFDLTGTLELIPVRITAEGTEFRARIAQGKFQSRVPGSQPQFDTMAAELAKPFLFTLKSGRTTEATLPQAVEPLVAGVFRSVSAAFQFVRPAGSDETWTASEFDTTGEYSAEYKKTSDPHRFEKRKQRYLALLLPKGQSKPAIDALPEIAASRGEVLTTADGRLLAITSEDELELKRAQTPIRTKMTLSLRAGAVVPASVADAELVALRSAGMRLGADQPMPSGVSPAVIDDAKINGLPFGEIVSRLEKAAKAAPKDSAQKADDPEQVAQREEHSRMFVALGATFRRQPEMVSKAIDKIRANSPAKYDFIDALGAASSPQANEALIALVQPTTSDVKIRTSALINLSRLEQPTAETTAALEKLLDDTAVGTQALYGIGSYCRRFRERGEVERAAALGRILVTRLAATKTELRTNEALRAIANSGFVGALESIRPRLTDARDSVRAEAVRSLRLMNAPEVDGILIRRLNDDSVKAVRLAALDAMQARPPAPALVQALRSSISTEDPHVRYRVVELMSRWLSKQPELRQSLELVAKNEQEEKIRELAKAAL